MAKVVTPALENMREGTAHREDQNVYKVDPNRRGFENAFLEEWVFISDTPSQGPSAIEASMHHNTNHSEHIPVTPRTWEKMRRHLRGRTCSLEGWVFAGGGPCGR